MIEFRMREGNPGGRLLHQAQKFADRMQQGEMREADFERAQSVRDSNENPLKKIEMDSPGRR